jgi:hypothetical protein
MNTQFLVIGTNDSDCEASLALLTRKVFSNYEEAKQHADQPSLVHRNPQVVECHFPISTNQQPSTIEIK